MKSIYVILAALLVISPAVASNMTDDFETIDVNHDGVITPSEMATAQRESLDEQNNGIMKLLDKDADGVISQEEYMAFYSKLASNEKEMDTIRSQFTKLDTDASGNISADELASFRAGSLDSENKEFFEAVDVDKDGQVTRKEYDNFVSGLKGIFDSVGSDYLK
ncbi:MAG: EF-hand domain-containing protein [Alphaproteobacteria bacterium]|nr:EF-hand domain-containing protein [Alphaproteobacteria bacterium]